MYLLNPTDCCSTFSKCLSNKSLCLWTCTFSAVFSRN
nr:MAG TPA: hypothetical protein [Caudoviricetes sp.]